MFIQPYFTDITNAILSATESSIPSKIVTIRKGGPKWLSCNIRKMIRQKNRIHRKAKHFNNPMHWDKFRKIRNEATSLVRNAKDKYNNYLIQKIINMNSSCKNWWNIVKQISGIKGSDMSIPPILHNDNLIFKTFSTSFSHNLISLIWFVTCDKLGILLLESSISDCFETYIRKAKHFNNPMHWNKFMKIRNEVTSLVRTAKDKYAMI
jgi:hypothetical protein